MTLAARDTIIRPLRGDCNGSGCWSDLQGAAAHEPRKAVRKRSPDRPGECMTPLGNVERTDACVRCPTEARRHDRPGNEFPGSYKGNTPPGFQRPGGRSELGNALVSRPAVVEVPPGTFLSREPGNSFPGQTATHKGPTFLVMTDYYFRMISEILANVRIPRAPPTPARHSYDFGQIQP